jgi:polyhydroxyalkanoate synthase
MRQLIDVFAPTNVPCLNPVVLRRTFAEGGFNVLRGVQNWTDDLDRSLTGRPPTGAEAFQIGPATSRCPRAASFSGTT